MGPTLKVLSSSLEQTNALFILIPGVSAINFKQDNSVSLSLFVFLLKESLARIQINSKLLWSKYLRQYMNDVLLTLLAAVIIYTAT